MDIKFDFDDILITPSSVSNIDSRNEIDIYDDNGMLPLFTAPMFDVVSDDNINIFINNKIYGINPRRKEIDYNISNIISHDPKRFVSFGLNEFNNIFLNTKDINFIDNIINSPKPIYVLIDIANGHMTKLITSIKTSKKIYGDKLVLMVGNIANPETYHILSDAGAKYIRVGIGNGSGCLTTEQSSIGYPLASLISDTHAVSLKINNPAKIVADGGLKKYADIIKALALGADYCMLGGILNKSLESSSKCYSNFQSDHGQYVEISNDKAYELFNNGEDVYKQFRGMSSKSVQSELGNKILKTSEGIIKYNKVEYTMSGWVENFDHYLKSAMSYTGKRNLKDFIGRVDYNMITTNAFKRYNK